MPRKRKLPVYALADPARRENGNGTCVVASYQSSPETFFPFKIRAIKENEPDRLVIVALTYAEALKLARDFLSFAEGETEL